MANDYLWDRSGVPERTTKELEELLAPATHDAPLDELRLAKRGALPRATAHEPAPPESGRKKGKMSFFLDIRVIGTATVTAAACGLLALTLLHPSDSPPRPPRMVTESPPAIPAVPMLANPTHAVPVAPMGVADLAITAGETVWIHTKSGGADVEIQAPCNAEIELRMKDRFVARPDPSRGIVLGTARPDGRATTYHVSAGNMDGMFEYTSRCPDQPPVTGMVVVDQGGTHEPITSRTNARVYGDEFISADTVAEGFHVFGTVSPGASVSIGTTPIAVEPGGLLDTDVPRSLTFTTNTPIRLDHLVTTVRVDDAKGTHFYVMRASTVMFNTCVMAMSAHKLAAAELDERGDHAAALDVLAKAMKDCKPDRETLSLALDYACKAGNAAAANGYWRLLPPELQRRHVDSCAVSGITF